MSENHDLVTVRITAKDGSQLFVGTNGEIGQIELYAGVGAMTANQDIEGIQLITPVSEKPIVGQAWRVWWKSPSGFKSTGPISEADGPAILAKLLKESSFEHWLLKDGEFPPGYFDGTRFEGIGDTAEELSRGYSVPPFSEILASFRAAVSKAAKIQFEQEDGPNLTITIGDAINLAKSKIETSIGEQSEDLLGSANLFANGAWEDLNSYRRKSGANELQIDPELRDAFAQRLVPWIKTAADNSKRADDAEAKLAFLKTKGLTVGVAKEAGKDPYLAYVIEPGSELCDLETVNKLIQAELTAKNLEDSAAEYAKSRDYWRGIIQACYEQLPDEMQRRARMSDDGEIGEVPFLSRMPDVVKFLADMAYIWIPGTLSTKGAQAVLDEVTTRLSKAGFGFVADGTAYGNGIFVNRLAVRETHEPTAKPGERLLPSPQENPDGLHCRYWIRKADGRLCDPDAVYFVLRLDNGGTDPAHIKASRFAARMYAVHLQINKAAHLEQLAKELSELCNKIDHDEQVDFPGFNVAEIRDMLNNPVAFDLAHDYNAAQEVQADAFGADNSAKWHKERGDFLKARAVELEAKF